MREFHGCKTQPCHSLWGQYLVLFVTSLLLTCVTCRLAPLLLPNCVLEKAQLPSCVCSLALLAWATVLPPQTFVRFALIVKNLPREKKPPFSRSIRPFRTMSNCLFCYTCVKPLRSLLWIVPSMAGGYGDMGTVWCTLLFQLLGGRDRIVIWRPVMVKQWLWSQPGLWETLSQNNKIKARLSTRQGSKQTSSFSSCTWILPPPHICSHIYTPTPPHPTHIHSHVHTPYTHPTHLHNHAYFL